VKNLLAASIEDTGAIINYDRLPVVNANTEAMETVFLNIISNAIKYSKPGGTIDLNWRALDKEQSEISICDNGVGMSPSNVKAISKGETIKSSLGTMNEKGTGIGLQIVHELIKINHGDVKLTSQVDKGTCFYLYLPRN